MRARRPQRQQEGIISFDHGRDNDNGVRHHTAGGTNGSTWTTARTGPSAEATSHRRPWLDEVTVHVAEGNVRGEGR